MESITRKEIEQYTPASYDSRLLPFKDLFNELVALHKEDPRNLEGFPTLSWPVFHEAFGGARPGELVVITADTGMGKTTFALNWMLDMIRSKKHSLLISLEMRWSAMAMILGQMIQGKRFTEFKDEDISAIYEVLKDLRGWYLFDNGPQKLEFISKAIEVAADKYGCQFVVLDHFDYIMRQMAFGQSESYLIGDIMRRLCGLAHRTKTTIVLIVHPSKTNQKGISHREIGMDELKGSSSIKQEADAVMSLYQPNPDMPETILRFQKIRAPWFSQNRDGFIRYRFDPNSLRLTEVSTKIEWGSA